METRNSGRDGQKNLEEPSPDAWMGMLRSRLDVRRKFFEGQGSPPAPSTGNEGESRKTKSNPPDHQGGQGDRVSHRAVPFALDSVQSAKPDNSRHHHPVEVPRQGDSEFSQSSGHARLERESRAHSERSSSTPPRSGERRGSIRYEVEGVGVLLGWNRDYPITAEDTTSSAMFRRRSNTQINQSSRRTDAFRGANSSNSGAVPPADENQGNLNEGELISFDPDRFQKVGALVIDLSQSGIRLILDQPPPPDRKIWLGNSHMQLVDWSEVRLKSVSEHQPGRFMVRLAFVKACPYDVFKCAVMLRSVSSNSTTPPHH